MVQQDESCILRGKGLVRMLFGMALSLEKGGVVGRRGVSPQRSPGLIGGTHDAAYPPSGTLAYQSGQPLFGRYGDFVKP
jgi:hypothetical protein